MARHDIELYTDGSATTADKPGGYGYVIVINGKVEETGSGHLPLATNNDAELEGAIKGLENVYEMVNERLQPLATYTVTLVCDSQLVLGWASGAYKFKQLNKLHKYEELLSLVKRMGVQTRWVEGHSGDKYNEQCDKLANAARLHKTMELQKELNTKTGESLIGDKKTGIICIWYMDQLKVIDMDNNVIENYSQKVHGKRGSLLQIREEKNR